MHPKVHEASLSHADSCEDNHHDLEADSQLTDQDRLVGESHLDIWDSLTEPEPGRDHGIKDRHKAVVVAADGVCHPK